MNVIGFTDFDSSVTRVFCVDTIAARLSVEPVEI